MTVRLVTPEDYPVIAEWWEARPEAGAFNELLLPPVGCVAEDGQGLAASVFAYFSVGIGVAFLEYAATRPGLTLAESTEAFRLVMKGIEEACIANNYTWLVAWTRPGAKRVIGPLGWETGSERKMVPFIRNLQDRLPEECLRRGACAS